MEAANDTPDDEDDDENDEVTSSSGGFPGWSLLLRVGFLPAVLFAPWFQDVAQPGVLGRPSTSGTTSATAGPSGSSIPSSTLGSAPTPPSSATRGTFPPFDQQMIVASPPAVPTSSSFCDWIPGSLQLRRRDVLIAEMSQDWWLVQSDPGLALTLSKQRKAPYSTLGGLVVAGFQFFGLALGAAAFTLLGLATTGETFPDLWRPSSVQHLPHPNSGPAAIYSHPPQQHHPYYSFPHHTPLSLIPNEVFGV